MTSPLTTASPAVALEPAVVRPRFPALAGGDVFFDNPGGTQVPQSVIDAVSDCLVRSNANLGGAFTTSRAADSVVAEARLALRDLLNAERVEEIVFGPNMTTLTLGLSRAFGRELAAGDEIIVTRLDHDANVAPWLLLARDRGLTVRFVDFDRSDGTLCLDQLTAALGERTRLVAVAYASNALGTINPVARIVELAHAAGALCFVDAVHYAPHGPIDVQALGCDFLAVSVYKFFGPHVGVLYGRYDLLERLDAYKVRPSPPLPPDKLETGTLSHEGLAGSTAAVDYLASLASGGGTRSRRQRLLAALARIRATELELAARLIATLEPIRGLCLYGLADPTRLGERVPTVAFTLASHTPRQVATALAAVGIYAWDGNYYALEVTRHLGVEERGGMVRVGLVDYNTVAEIERLGEALAVLVARA